MTLLTDELGRTNDTAAPDRHSVDRAKHEQLAKSAIAVLQTLLVLSIWLLTRGYSGIRHDARIYIGRALADLDPNGVGRDALFAFDHQTHLTIYSILTVPLVRLLGASTGTIVITYLTLLIWLPTAAWLASRMMPRRFIPAALICVATLPAVYGPFGIFSFGEPFAVPRGLAEASVLFSLTALLNERRLLACAALLFSAALHVPTALAGAGVVFIMLASEMPILWLIASVLGAVTLAAGLLHLGPAKILFQSYDPAWLALNHERNPFLFESRWPAETWGQTIVSGATLLTAAVLTQSRIRQVLIATAVVAAAGVLASYILGELPSNILILDLQPWRTLWLVKLLAIMMCPLCAYRLWLDGRRDSRLAIILLACAWYAIDSPWLAIPTSLAALTLIVRGHFGLTDRTPGFLLWAAVLAGLVLILVWVCSDVAVEVRLLRATFDADAPFSAQLFLPLLATLGFFAAAVAVALSIKPWPATPTWRAWSLMALVAVLLPLALLSADHRDATRVMNDVGAGRETLTDLLGPTPNGIVWVGNDNAPLFWAGRPTWVNYLQGTAGAFSRPLAMQWDVRSRLLVASGLATENDRDPFLPRRDTDFDPAVIARGAVTVCKTPTGPDAIVSPYDLTKYFPSGRVKIWHTPIHDVVQIQALNQHFSYVHRDRYFILRCADFR